ncbi:MAG TPA: hypothetical protein VJ984_11765 [Xanthomonadales bacterium]|nr:hypothetical protein [Xanthomonadales bacterium]
MAQQLNQTTEFRKAAAWFAWLVAAFMPLSVQANIDEPDQTTAATEETPETQDACDWKLKDQEIQEQTREVFRGAACHTFRWFDGLFGDEQDYPENEIKGWTIFGAEYTQYDGFDPRLRVRVRAPLPNMNRRWDLILGRVDETSYVSDTDLENKTFFNPGAVNEQDDEPEWLLGLGHRGRSKRSGWDWSAGVRLRLPPRPYAKLQYYYNKSFSQDTALSFRQTFFWRSDDGFGTTSRGEVTHDIDASNVMRFEGIATNSDVTLGWDWYVGHTWYHRFSGKNGISLLTFVNGETDNPVVLKDYGFNLIWRRPFTREWMFLSMGPSLTWPRELESEEREMSLGFGVWIEIEFGDWRY